MMQNTATKQNQTSLLCSLLERYLDLNPNQNAAQAIFSVTTFSKKSKPMYRNHSEQNRYMTNSEIIKGLQTWLNRHDADSSTVNETLSNDLYTLSPTITIKLGDEDWLKFVEELDSA